jgi:hypothetical protein
LKKNLKKMSNEEKAEIQEIVETALEKLNEKGFTGTVYLNINYKCETVATAQAGKPPVPPYNPPGGGG